MRKISNTNSEILDQNTNHYVIRWGGFLSPLDPRTYIASIRKKDGTRLGTIKSGGCINRYTSLLDSKKKIVLTSSKSKIWNHKYFIKDESKNVLGHVSVKWFSSKTQMYMKNKHGVKILNLNGLYLPMKTHEIVTVDGKLVAKFAFGHDSSSHFASLRIVDSNYDRKVLWGFFISFVSSFYDNNSNWLVLPLLTP